MKILIVEDDHFYSLRLKELLSDNGLESDLAASVEQALGLQLETYDAIISDLMLPNDPAKSGVSPESVRGGFFSGVALCREIKKRGLKMPLIILSGGIIGSEAGDWAGEQQIPFILKDEGPRPVLYALEKVGILGNVPTPKAFIVHGHDEAALAELKDYLQNTLKWQEPVVLREQPSRGKTIIEKFEEVASRIDCVFVLLTPDDKDVNLSTDDEKRRARQNVIFELGFFYAQMGRKSGRVIALRKGPVDLPSDIQGIVWVDVTHGIKAAGETIREEVAHIAN
jgi:CheY-like chemotaxis protein